MDLNFLHRKANLTECQWKAKAFDRWREFVDKLEFRQDLRAQL